MPRLLQFLKAEVTRQADVTRILPLINELEALRDSDCIVRSPQSQRPSVSERVGEEAEVNPSPVEHIRTVFREVICAEPA